MYDFQSYRCGNVDWPISTVKRRSVLKSELDRKLDEFEGLVLSPQDDGFLRLARLVLQSPPSPPPKRDDGLIS